MTYSFLRPDPVKTQVEGVSAATRLAHVPERFAHGQLWVIPSRAIRAVVVNGVTYRGWLSPEPTTVGHVGDTLLSTMAATGSVVVRMRQQADLRE